MLARHHIPSFFLCPINCFVLIWACKLLSVLPLTGICPLVGWPQKETEKKKKEGVWHKSPGTDKGDQYHQSSDRSQVGYVKEKSKLLVLPNQQHYSQAGGGQRKCHSAQRMKHQWEFRQATSASLSCLNQLHLCQIPQIHCVPMAVWVGHHIQPTLCNCGIGSGA